MGFFNKLSKSSKILTDDGTVDKATQELLLSNPAVQNAMKQAGQEAIHDPAVQEAIIKVAKENLTAENAAKVADMAKTWVQDPEVQAKARHYAGMAMAYSGQAGQMVVGCIEQGPTGLRFLAFLTGCASCVNAGLTVANVANVLGLVSYAIAIYQVIFALTTMLFEASPDHIAKIPGLNGYQDMLIEYAKFLSSVLGRGLFYIFQGVLWLFTVSSITHIVTLAIGASQCLIGVFHMLMYWGIMPQHVAAKAREAGQSYQDLNR